jgi:hypothetical protein
MKPGLALNDFHCVKVDRPVLMLPSVFGLNDWCLVIRWRLFIDGFLPKTGQRIPDTRPGRDKIVSGIRGKVITRIGEDPEIRIETVLNACTDIRKNPASPNVSLNAGRGVRETDSFTIKSAGSPEQIGSKMKVRSAKGGTKPDRSAGRASSIGTGAPSGLI